MERAQGSCSNFVEELLRRRQLRASQEQIAGYQHSVNQLSPEGKRTHMIINSTRKRMLNTKIGTYCTVYDNTAAPYTWLRPGWLVEERCMIHSGRLYRYYYDPAGQMYNTRQEVDQIIADLEATNRVVIVIDDD
ncbi:unnamed protein product [Microthlaspi erraticum]|uniref:MBD domain-containing protein n=1 Tax=Microthlaspi erraticum TaxID=1685480 RepID=A0A6D2J2P2_9BRAS|nr:unnamed protein product [Microthlaspi erraticum]